MGYINKIQTSGVDYDISDKRIDLNISGSDEGKILTVQKDGTIAAQDAPASGVISVTAGDNSITMGGTTANPTVATTISSTSGNMLSLDANGLMVTEVANTVHDANYAHITVTDTSVSDGTNTFAKVDEIYWCTYGTTTAAEISTALSAGKLVACIYDGFTYTYYGIASNRHVFSAVGQTASKCLLCKTADSTWSTTSASFEKTSNKVTSIDSSSTNTEYPSAKCVYDQLAAKVINDGTLTMQVNGTTKSTFTANDSNNITFNVTTADLGLPNIMNFVGVSTTNPKGDSGATVEGHTTWKKGDVVLYGTKEFVLTANSNVAANWTELGDEGSHALKTITITGTGALSGGGTLEANRTITHNETADAGKSKTEGLYKVATDAYGHISSATAVAKSDITALGIPAQDTTYNDATTSTHGLMSTSDKSKLDGITAQATKTAASSTNGKISINGTDTTVYTHPSYTTKSSGLYKVAVDSTGHVNSATAVAKSDITALGIPGEDTNTTYTFASGTGGFTVTPSGGSAQTVTVTPSVATASTLGAVKYTNGTTSSVVACTTAVTGYGDYEYRGSIAVSGITTNHIANVYFSVADILTHEFAGFCETYDGGIYIYKKTSGSTSAVVSYDATSIN